MEFISGSVVAVLLLLSLAGDNVLLSLTLSSPSVDGSDPHGPGTRNLLWALTVFSAVYASSRGLRNKSFASSSSDAALNPSAVRARETMHRCAANGDTKVQEEESGKPGDAE